MTADPAVPALVRLRDVSKTFGSTTVLKQVSFDIRGGEVFGLVGHNGSGKSTIVKILAGYHDPDGGSSITVGGTTWSSERIHGPGLRQLRFIHQDLGLIPTIGAADNIGMVAGYRRHRSGTISWKQQRDHAHELISTYGLQIDVDEPVGRLSGGAQAVVCIARALQGWDETTPGLLVIDEATAALHPAEASVLNNAVLAAARAGHAVLYISHRLDEVLELCGHVGVLRDGELVSEGAVGAMSVDDLAAAVAGRTLDRRRHEPDHARGAGVLSVRGLCGPDVLDVDLDVAAGEVVGVAGLQGSGRDELAGLVFGAVAPLEGTVAVAGRRVDGISPGRAVKHGMAMVPSKRSMSVVAQLTARENITLTRVGDYRRRGVLRRRHEEADVLDWLQRLDVRPPDPEFVVGRLSGGNQQKIALGKWMRIAPQVLVIDEPTQGVDAGAREGIYDLVRRAAEAGAGVLVCSSDEKELARICARVLVMRSGRIGTELSGDRLTAEDIIKESQR